MSNEAVQPATAATDSLAWSRFAPILSVQFIGTLGYSIAIPFLVFLVEDFGGATWTYGIVGATYSACQLVGAPLLGRWSDAAGRRPVLIASQAGTLIAWLIFLAALAMPLEPPLATLAGASLTIPLLLVFAARALDGVTGGNMSVANAYVADLTRDDPGARGVAFGRMGIAASLGFALGPALAGVLGATTTGYWAPVAAAAGISGLAMLLSFTLHEPGGRCPQGPEPPPAIARVMGQQQKRCDRTEPEAGPGVFTRPLIIGLLVATFVQFTAFNLFYAGFPVHATVVLEWSAGRMGLFFTLMSVIMICAQGPLLRYASRYLPAATVFLLGMLGLVGAFVAFALPGTIAPFIGATLFAIGNGLAWPTFQAQLAGAAGPADQGAVQGAATSAGSLASILGLVVGGLLYPWMQADLFWAGAALFVAVAIGTPLWFARSTS